MKERLMVETQNEVQVLDNIPCELDFSKVKKWLRTHGDSSRFEKAVQELIEVMAPIARPKAVYKVSYIGDKHGEAIEIDGVQFGGTLLQVNLEKGQRVFPFVVTCGKEADAIQVPSSDSIKHYCLDVLKTSLAVSAASYLQNYLKEKYTLEQLSVMNPGELESWPLTQQKPLFALLGNVEDMIGVRLTENFGMIPLKSRSGIYFSSQTKFESCQFCTRQRCVGRRAAYDPELAKKYKEKAKGICG
jgi:hypothetical protein